jgi:hypothetical protein
MGSVQTTRPGTRLSPRLSPVCPAHEDAPGTRVDLAGPTRPSIRSLARPGTSAATNDNHGGWQIASGV